MGGVNKPLPFRGGVGVGHIRQTQSMPTGPTPPPLCGSSPPLKGRGFKDAALQLCGQCALLLGWRPAEFWDATPAELTCVLSAYAPHEQAPPDPADMRKLMELFPDG